MACSVYFLVAPGTTFPWGNTAYSALGSPVPTISQENAPKGLPTGQSDGGISSAETPSAQMTLACVSLGKQEQKQEN